MAEIWIPERFGPRDPVALRESQKTLIRPAGIAFHTAVVNNEKLRPTGVIRWTAYLGKSGTLYPFFSCNRPAACQADGNYWRENNVGWGFNSMESWDGRGVVWDGVHVEDCPEWNAAQCKTIVDSIVWHADTFNLPIRKPKHCRERGYGVHNDFTVSPANENDLHWNIRHACPAPRRTRQFPQLRAEAARKGASPVPLPKPPEDIVTPDDIEKIAQRAAELVWFERLKNPVAAPGDIPPHASSYLVAMANKVDVVKGDVAGLDAIPADVDDLRKQVANMFTAVQEVGAKVDDLASKLQA